MKGVIEMTIMRKIKLNSLYGKMFMKKTMNTKLLIERIEELRSNYIYSDDDPIEFHNLDKQGENK